MWLKRPSHNPCLRRLQQEREKLQAEVAELQDDLKLLQGILRHKQQKLREVNQGIVTRTRHAAEWYVIDNGCAELLQSNPTPLNHQPATLALVAK